MVRGPLGGLIWHHLQYVLGLAKLGHDVYFLEDSDDWRETWSQSFVMTLDTYPHVLPSMQQAVTEKLEKTFFSKAGTL